jgi:adenine-specific DNA-methyltransferase
MVNNKNNTCFNQDANELINVIDGDILYIDPPYNSRQYGSNYHLLETVSRYDSPNIYGKTGIRPYDDVKSKYCQKRNALKEFTIIKMTF